MGRIHNVWSPSVSAVHSSFLTMNVTSNISHKITYNLPNVQKMRSPLSVNHKIQKHRHFPLTSLSKVSKGAYISGIKVFNHLPQYIKDLSNNQTHFKSTLKRFLCHHSFYSMNEYYEYKEDRRI